MSKPLNLALIWNMHQPYYKDLVSGEYILPWVRLHGIKDYYDMVHILSDYPDIHQTFNMVPSLIKQIEDYATTDFYQLNERFLKLTIKPPAELSVEERAAILFNFFLANWDNLIKIYPRYYELLLKRGEQVTKEELLQIQENFTGQELLDLQVWYNLAWFDPTFKEGIPELKQLIKKGRDFSEEDKRVVLGIQRQVMQKILPEYKKLQDQGQIEICLSPLYHPILPILCDSNAAKMALPEIDLPHERFQHPEDAKQQVLKGIECYKNAFGCLPQGMWPSEGSLSEEVVPILAQAGIKWVATDEEILAKSLDTLLERNHDDQLKQPHVLYRPYNFHTADDQVTILFRDHLLSDLIGFVYTRWDDAAAAAQDLCNRLHGIRDALGDNVDNSLVTIILDGENAWEYYKNDGQDFLHALYQKLSADPLLNSVTVSEYLEKHPPETKLPQLFSGSWINHNFGIWIGHEDDNRAWDFISKARRELVNWEKQHSADQDITKKLAMAWEELYIAQGSDWFWWYGDDHSSENDADFDQLFRKHLINIYTLIGVEVPVELHQPLISNLRKQGYQGQLTLPRGLILPHIDGKISSYFEWLDAGQYLCKGSTGTMQSVSGYFKQLLYGFSNDQFFLRIDFADSVNLDSLGDAQLWLHLVSPVAVVLKIPLGSRDGLIKNSMIDSTPVHCLDNVRVAFDHLFEIALPLADLGMHQAETINFFFHLKKAQKELDRSPQVGSLPALVPCQGYEATTWQV